MEEFLQKVIESLTNQAFVKLTLSKKSPKSSDLNNIYIRLVTIKDTAHLSFTYRHTTKDIVKNFTIEEGIEKIKEVLGTSFLEGHLFTTKENVKIAYNKKRIPRISTSKPTITTLPTTIHNRQKHRYITEDRPFLVALGIANKQGKILKNKHDKFRQINKYIEIIDGLIENTNLPNQIHIVDMGSGKGYLTFALYDYLSYKLSLNVTITGVELRENLVQFCNETAEKLNFSGLKFIASDIHDYHPDRIDMLIALHACDIATDIAIYKGIVSKSEIIVCAPCCHKQIRRQMNCQNDLQAILKHGILEERQAEMITDGIRALILEGNGYKSKVFEFISSEHTSKNLMIVGTQTKSKDTTAFTKVAAIKQQFGIESHYLEELLKKK